MTLSKHDLRTNIALTREAITALFGSQMEASRQLHVHERTVRWWCQYGAPRHVLIPLYRLKDGEISLRWARHLIRSKRTRRLNGMVTRRFGAWRKRQHRRA